MWISSPPLTPEELAENEKWKRRNGRYISAYYSILNQRYVPSFPASANLGRIERPKSNKWKITHIARRYKVSREEAARLLSERSKSCYVCNSTDRCMIDHNHTTDRVRGILCYHCNFAVGLAKDDPERLERLAKYLRDADGAEVAAKVTVTVRK